MNAMSPASRAIESRVVAQPDREYLSFTIDAQLFGVPVLKVQDVLNTRPLAHIPLAPKEVAGSLNLRGRIVTAINLRRRMELPDAADGERHMGIVVDFEGELYSLLVDAVGDVLRLSHDTFEANPATLNPLWRDLSLGVHRLKDKLLIVLDVERMLSFTNER